MSHVLSSSIDVPKECSVPFWSFLILFDPFWTSQELRLQDHTIITAHVCCDFYASSCDSMIFHDMTWLETIRDWASHLAHWSKSQKKRTVSSSTVRASACHRLSVCSLSTQEITGRWCQICIIFDFHLALKLIVFAESCQSRKINMKHPMCFKELVAVMPCS